MWRRSTCMTVSLSTVIVVLSPVPTGQNVKPTSGKFVLFLLLLIEFSSGLIDVLFDTVLWVSRVPLQPKTQLTPQVRLSEP